MGLRNILLPSPQMGLRNALVMGHKPVTADQFEYAGRHIDMGVFVTRAGL